MRRVAPWLTVLLSVLATLAAAGPWLRSFPADVLAVPLAGAALVAVALPLLVHGPARGRLRVTLAVGLLAFAGYTLVAVLRDPAAVGALLDGLWRGPAQLLTYSVPLVSPRTLLVVPVAVCWLTGLVAGEALARGWTSLVPYGGWVGGFVLAYGGTARAAGPDATTAASVDALLAGALLATLLSLRAVQSWARLDAGLTGDAVAPATDRAGARATTLRLPLRSLVGGLVVALAVSVGVVVLAPGPLGRASVAPQRQPRTERSAPVTPTAFVAGLRTSADPDAPLLSVTLDRESAGYVALAEVDLYDGDSWTFARDFRPSGGAVPTDPDPALAAGDLVTQRYSGPAGALVGAAWLPHLSRVEQVTGLRVDVDAASGTAVPSDPLPAGAAWTVRSRVAALRLENLGPGALAALSRPAAETRVPPTVRTPLADVVEALAGQLGVPASPPLPFLAAVRAEFVAAYGLADDTAEIAGTPGPTATGSPAAGTGGTAFAEVLAAVLGPRRTGTPEQYATLFALLARQVGVPARVVSGLRAAGGAGAPAGRPVALTGADAWTWVELPVRDVGWVVADPTPSRRGEAAPSESVGAAPSVTPSVTPPAQALVTPGAGGNAIAPSSTVSTGGSGPPAWQRWGAVGLAAAAALAAAGLLAVPVRRVLRRRRRRRGSPAQRVLGAWGQTLDRLRDSGFPDVATLTAAQVAAAHRDRFGDAAAEPAGRLGELANVAVFDPTAALDDASAELAWQLDRSVAGAVAAAIPLRRRLFAALVPGVRSSRRPV